ncbi:Hypothetical protein SMAX5B_019009 [Scophthalmus maximus]|uniref:Uncharacterized protein n=1 Tax=Scophthalmus maximus TaxID=52904 RepID=A0A2U9C7H0_SCOMX|nr:Hypothetical protein SMAX5B_019009 [Scophthalmus maximus]
MHRAKRDRGAGGGRREGTERAREALRAPAIITTQQHIAHPPQRCGSIRRSIRHIPVNRMSVRSRAGTGGRCRGVCDGRSADSQASKRYLSGSFFRPPLVFCAD